MKVLLVGADIGSEDDFDKSMKELDSLACACGYEVVGSLTQKMKAFHRSLYIGTGKVEEIRQLASQTGAEQIICEESLSPSQIRNLNAALQLPVVDRTNLILDIFATRARTREAKLQVETARLRYLLPRLVGLHDALSRQGGTGGSMSNRGAGEKKLELDRRKIEHRIHELEKELQKVEKERETQRKRRERSFVPQVCLAGYTNAGKSTVMNAMVERYQGRNEKKVLEKDMLFATLETAVRKIDDGSGKPFYLSDTVGFIHKLPPGLIKAFRSTLEEIRHADLILHVLDYSAPDYKKQMQVTKKTLEELSAGHIPVIELYNKSDLCMDKLPKKSGNKIYMSAKTKEGLAELTEMIEEALYADEGGFHDCGST